MADEIRAQDFGPGLSRAVVVELGPSIKPDLLDLAPDEMGQSGLSVKPGRESTATVEVRDLAVVLLVALPSCAEAVEIAGEFIAAEVATRPELTHTRWLWLKNFSNLPVTRQGQLHQLMRPSARLATARAPRWREDFPAFYDQDPSYAPEYPRRWCCGATRSRPQPIKDFVALVEKRWDARHRLAYKPPQQRPARRDQLHHPGRQSPRPGLLQQKKMITIVYLTAAKLRLPTLTNPTPAYMTSR